VRKWLRRQTKGPTDRGGKMNEPPQVDRRGLEKGSKKQVYRPTGQEESHDQGVRSAEGGGGKLGRRESKKSSGNAPAKPTIVGQKKGN